MARRDHRRTAACRKCWLTLDTTDDGKTWTHGYNGSILCPPIHTVEPGSIADPKED